MGGWDAALKASDDAAARGDTANQLVRIKDNKRQYKSLGGAWVDEANVMEGHRRWGNNQFAQQAALSYEMRKAMEEGDVSGLSTRYNSLATEQWGLSERQAAGNWIGASFENQNQHLQYKATDSKGKIDHHKLATELYEKKGSYPAAQMSSQMFEELGIGYDNATKAIENHNNGTAVLSSEDLTKNMQTRDRIAAVSETFVHDIAAGAPGIQTGNPTNNTEAIPGAGGVKGRQTAGSGAAHVNERINWLANKTGRLQNKPSNPHPGADSPQK
jgi:hypothetical protein